MELWQDVPRTSSGFAHQLSRSAPCTTQDPPRTSSIPRTSFRLLPQVASPGPPQQVLRTSPSLLHALPQGSHLAFPRPFPGLPPDLPSTSPVCPPFPTPKASPRPSQGLPQDLQDLPRSSSPTSLWPETKNRPHASFSKKTKPDLSRFLKILKTCFRSLLQKSKNRF